MFVLATGSNSINDRWLQPVLFTLPLACAVALEAQLDRRRLMGVAALGSGLAMLVVVLLLAFNRFPDWWGEQSATAAPFKEMVNEVRALGFSRGTIIGQGFGSGNLIFRLPNTKAVTTEYPGLPIDYEPPVLIVWHRQLSDEERASVGRAYRSMCGQPLPAEVDAKALQAPYVGSAEHLFTLNVALIGRC